MMVQPTFKNYDSSICPMSYLFSIPVDLEKWVMVSINTNCYKESFSKSSNLRLALRHREDSRPQGNRRNKFVILQMP